MFVCDSLVFLLLCECEVRDAYFTRFSEGVHSVQEVEPLLQIELYLHHMLNGLRDRVL